MNFTDVWMTILNVAVSIIYRVSQQSQEILFIRRTKPPYRGYLALPGGKLKFGEPLNIGVKREIIEETGIGLDKVDLYALVNELYYDQNQKLEGHFLLYYMVSKLSRKIDLVSSDEGELKWLKVDYLDDDRQDIVPSDFEIINEYFQNLQLGVTDIRYYECKLISYPVETDLSKDEILNLSHWEQIS